MFKHVGDSQQIARLGRQIFPQNKQVVLEAYTLYGYLVVKLRPYKTFLREFASKSKPPCIISSNSRGVTELLPVAKPILIKL